MPLGCCRLQILKFFCLASVQALSPHSNKEQLSERYLLRILSRECLSHPIPYILGHAHPISCRFFPALAALCHSFFSISEPALRHIWLPFQLYSGPEERHNAFRSSAMHIQQALLIPSLLALYQLCQ